MKQKDFSKEVDQLKRQFNTAFETAIHINADRLKQLEEIKLLKIEKDRYKKALNKIISKLSGINDVVTNDILSIASKALTPKTSSDELY